MTEAKPKWTHRYYTELVYGGFAFGVWILIDETFHHSRFIEAKLLGPMGNSIDVTDVIWPDERRDLQTLALEEYMGDLGRKVANHTETNGGAA